MLLPHFCRFLSHKLEEELVFTLLFYDIASLNHGKRSIYSGGEPGVDNYAHAKIYHNRRIHLDRPVGEH